MIGGGTVIFDVGKTHAKLSLWDNQANLLARVVHSNAICKSAEGYRSLDIQGVQPWLMDSLAKFSRLAAIENIVPVAHGAGAVVVQGEDIWADPLDYEQELDSDLEEDYDQHRPGFQQTGSPRLPRGLNLGRQLFFLEQLKGRLPENASILLWPQYWAWKLCGVAASEVSSLGCHTDLWNPREKGFSSLAIERGWNHHFPPIRRADETLGTLTAEISRVTGLPATCKVLCGIHDSNAALVSARAQLGMNEGELTTLSTGTWFIAMRSPDKSQSIDSIHLQESRDCLINVDMFNQPVPSARFMGGREYEILENLGMESALASLGKSQLAARLRQVVTGESALLPGLVKGTGPFPNSRSRWINRPKEDVDCSLVVQLYLALMSCTMLDLIGSQDRLLLEGRFAEMQTFASLMATLRPTQKVYVSAKSQDLDYGALRLAITGLPCQTAVRLVEPLGLDISTYADNWHTAATQGESI